jgi:signal transduction histidine kinase
VLQALNGESGIAYRSEGEVEKVVIYRQVPLTSWALVVEEPWEAATSPLLRTTVFAPLVLVPVLFLALVAMAFVTRQIVQPMQALAEKTSNLAWGEFESIQVPVGGILEIRQLQAGLNHLAQKVQSAQQNLHSYIGAITTGQEEERRRLARELHDDTIQSLIALKQRVQLLQFDNPNEGINHSLNELENLTEQTVENLRRMTRNLRPIYLEDLGLVPALQMLSNEVEKQNAIAVQFNRKGIERRLPPAIELALYRIAQEALNNVVQHSLASQAVLTLAFSQEDVCLDIIDNGKGFQVPPSPADFATEGHFGLLGLHERAELIGAVLSVKSSNHQGTHVHISLSLRKISNFDVDKELEIT